MTNEIILLTGTVNPDGMAFTAIQDKDIRQQQYIESIKFWLGATSLPIVFVENSNTDLSAYFKEEIDVGRIEVLHFSGNSFNKTLGKGVGELNCVEYGCINSELLKKANFIFKITGRYKVLNFNVFLNEYRDNPKTKLLLDFKWNLSFADSRFFGFDPAFVPDFLSKFRNDLNDSDGIYLEHVLAKSALIAIANGYAFKSMVALPRIEGYSASSGVQYNSRYLHWLRYKFKYVSKYKSFELGNLPWI